MKSLDHRSRVQAVGADDPPAHPHHWEAIAPRVDLGHQRAVLRQRKLVCGPHDELDVDVDRFAHSFLQDPEAPFQGEFAGGAFGIAEERDLEPVRDVGVAASTASESGGHFDHDDVRTGLMDGHASHTR